METFFRKIPIKNFSNLIKRYKHVKKNNTPPNYILLRATSCDYEAVLRLMKSAYYPEEPTSSSIAFRPNSIVEDGVLRSLTEGYSIIAKCKYNGDILGACINETTHSWDPDMKDDLACKVSSVKLRQLLHFFAYVQRVPDLWNKYQVQKIFEMAFLFVRKDERGKGMALKLMQQSRCLAADCGFGLIRVDATSHYTSKLCEKMKMKLVGEVPYCSYVGADQKPIFSPPEPHKSVKIYIDDEPQKTLII